VIILQRVAILGLGKMGKLHFKNCMHVRNVKVVAVADSSKRRLEYAQSLGVSHLYRDFHELLNDKDIQIDTVIVCLPNYMHFESITESLERELNVFTEKPLAASIDECKKIVDFVKEKPSKFMVGHNMRFIPAIEKVKDRIENGLIGGLEVLTIEEIINGPFHPHVVPTPVPEWWFDKSKTGGGVQIDLGYHLFDLFRYFSGEAAVLFCTLDHKYNLPIEDGAITILKSKEDVKGIINVGWYQIVIFPNYNFRLIAHGTSGYLSTEQFTPKNIKKHAVKEGTRNLIRRLLGMKINPLSYTYFYESYFKEIQHFFDCISEDKEPIVSAYDSLKVMELIEQSYKISKKP
jgi:predicted dehydrogenase